MATPHTSCRKGTTVLMTMRKGTKFVDKFIESKSKYVFLEDHGRIAIRDIRAMSIYKGVDYETHTC